MFNKAVPGPVSVLELFFFYICLLFLVVSVSDKSILRHGNMEKQNLQNILKISLNDISSDRHNLGNVIFNYTLYELLMTKRKFFAKFLIFQ